MKIIKEFVCGNISVIECDDFKCGVAKRDGAIIVPLYLSINITGLIVLMKIMIFPYKNRERTINPCKKIKNMWRIIDKEENVAVPVEYDEV